MGILAIRRQLTGGVLSLALATGAFAGCTFDRTVINAHVRDIDTSWIVPGKTTRAEVVRRIGLPATVKETGVGITKNSMRWVSVDTFEKKFEGGWIVTLTFADSIGYFSNDILVTFDAQGVVTLVSRTTSDGDKVNLVEWREVRE